MATALDILESRGLTGPTAENLEDVRIVYCCLHPVQGVFRILLISIRATLFDACNVACALYVLMCLRVCVQ